MKNSKGNQNITYTIVHYPFLWHIRIKVWGNQSLSRNTRRGSEVLISSVEGRAVGLSLHSCELTTLHISLRFLQFLIGKPNVLIWRLNPVQISNSTGAAMRDRIFWQGLFPMFWAKRRSSCYSRFPENAKSDSNFRRPQWFGGFSSTQINWSLCCKYTPLIKYILSLASQTFHSFLYKILS